MPYKERLKNGEERKRKKSKYRVTNASAYNQSLRKRGMISLYFPKGNLRKQFINDAPYQKGISGKLPINEDAYIQLIFTFYRLFGWAMRQITGYMEDYWRSLRLNIPIPSIGHLSDRFAKLSISVKQRCDRLAKRLANGEAVTIMIDSSGLHFGCANQWYETKYGKKSKQTPWRKMHLAIDADMNIHQIESTDTTVSDSEGLDRVMPADMPIERVVADGAYYDIERNEKLFHAGITPVIPPPSHAVVHGTDNAIWHDKIVQYIQDKGTVYAFHKKYGYGFRSLVEAQVFRIKRCIGETLLTQKIESQKSEGVIIANLINLWNSFGRCHCVKAQLIQQAA